MTKQRQRFVYLTPEEAAAVAAELAASHADGGDAGAKAAAAVAAAADGTGDDGSVSANVLVGAGAGNGAVRPVTSPVALPLKDYVQATGLTSVTATQQEEQFGRNVLTIKPPRFLQVLGEQLLAPLAMFQFFCAFLWMLDDYWQYTMFTLVSIVMLEFTTSFQRLRTLKTLRNMCTKP